MSLIYGWIYESRSIRLENINQRVKARPLKHTNLVVNIKKIRSQDGILLFLHIVLLFIQSVHW